MMDTDKRWDIISLSLVVNFVPDPSERGGRLSFNRANAVLRGRTGRMLRLAYMLLRESGLLFLAVSPRIDIPPREPCCPNLH